jgi:AraC family transcriptional regulator of adaptative response / DNA-3-methyladenine glycosylase II
LLDFYRRHRICGIESIEGETYSRVFILDKREAVGFFRVRPDGRKPELILEMCLSGTQHLLQVVQRVRHMFDLDADPDVIARAFAQSKQLSSLHGRYPGTRLARGFDPFETAIGTILGQVISVVHASRLMGQLAAQYGQEVRHPVSGDRLHMFPEPRILAEADLHALAVTRQKKTAIRELSLRVAEGAIHLEREQDPDDFKRAVRAIKGIGAWSAEYMALRALGDTDAFPATDLVLHRSMKASPQFDTDAIRPWRGYAAACLWNEQVHGSIEEGQEGQEGQEEEKDHAAV